MGFDNMKVGIINYGGGNVQSVVNAISFLEIPYVFSNKESELSECTHLILPGVGAFGTVIDTLRAQGLIEILNRLVLEKKKKLLGICIGMQILVEDGVEFGQHNGLGWIKGKCLKLDVAKDGLFLPHIGWNSVQVDIKSFPLFKGIEPGTSFYFVHSYAVKLAEEILTARCSYGEDFVAGLMKDNIYGVQFHPEKSQEAGLRLLKNFCEL
jgi:imidazole glycerol-phosphate synthase subunit HisH